MVSLDVDEAEYFSFYSENEKASNFYYNMDLMQFPFCRVEEKQLTGNVNCNDGLIEYPYSDNEPCHNVPMRFAKKLYGNNFHSIMKTELRGPQTPEERGYGGNVKPDKYKVRYLTEMILHGKDTNDVIEKRLVEFMERSEKEPATEDPSKMNDMLKYMFANREMIDFVNIVKHNLQAFRRLGDAYGTKIGKSAITKNRYLDSALRTVDNALYKS